MPKRKYLLTSTCRSCVRPTGPLVSGASPTLTRPACPNGVGNDGKCILTHTAFGQTTRPQTAQPQPVQCRSGTCAAPTPSAPVACDGQFCCGDISITLPPGYSVDQSNGDVILPHGDRLSHQQYCATRGFTEDGGFCQDGVGAIWDPNLRKFVCDNDNTGTAIVPYTGGSTILPGPPEGGPCRTPQGRDGVIINGVCTQYCGAAPLSRDEKGDLGPFGNLVAKGKEYNMINHFFNFSPPPDGPLGQNKANVYDKCGNVISMVVAEALMTAGEVVFIVHTDSGVPTILNYETGYYNKYPIKDFGCMQVPVPIPACVPRPPSVPEPPFKPSCNPEAVDLVLEAAGLPKMGVAYCKWFFGDLAANNGSVSGLIEPAPNQPAELELLIGDVD